MNLPNIPNLAKRILYIRRQFELSQSQLAKLAKTTQQAIQQAEKGKALQPRYLPLIAKELDLPLDWVMVGSTDAFSSEKGKKRKAAPKNMLAERDRQVLEHFKAMPNKDQKLIFELMRNRKKSGA
jgi:transcriptional regulator with XRE-family HTH domain